MEFVRFDFPMPGAVHPMAAEADARSMEWMRRFDLCASPRERDRLARTGCGHLAGRIAPRASLTGLQIVSDFFTWNVAFDDEYCDEGPLSREPVRLAAALSLIARAIETPEDGARVRDRYALALCDIRRRLEALATPAQLWQWLAAMRGWFFAEICKATNVAAEHVPSLDEYALLRLYSGGGGAFPILAAAAEGYAVPLEQLEDRRVKAVTEMAIALSTWNSDAVSYEKEAAREIGGHNLIAVVRREYRYTAAQAAARAGAMYVQVAELFVRLHERLGANASPELQRYLASLGHFVQASAHWCRASERYAVGAEAAAATSADALTEAASFDVPAQIASLAWWWHHDPAEPAAMETTTARRAAL